MPVDEEWRGRLRLRREEPRGPVHARELLQDDGVLHRGERVAAPGKGSVTRDQNRRRLRRIAPGAAERLHDREFGVALDGSLHFLAGEVASDRDVAEEIIGVGLSEAAEWGPGLGEDGGDLGWERCDA